MNIPITTTDQDDDTPFPSILEVTREMKRAKERVASKAQLQKTIRTALGIQASQILLAAVFCVVQFNIDLGVSWFSVMMFLGNAAILIHNRTWINEKLA